MEIKISETHVQEIGDREPMFKMYDLIIRENIYPFNLTKEWTYFYTKKRALTLEYYLILALCDENTYNACYCRLFNPIEIYLYNRQPNKIEKIKIGLCTIDDSYYGCEFNNLLSEEFDSIFYKVNDFILQNEFLNYEKLIEFLISLGGTDVSY